MSRFGCPDSRPSSKRAPRLTVTVALPADRPAPKVGLKLSLDDEEALAVAVALREAALSGVLGSDQAALSALLKLRRLLPQRVADRLGELTRRSCTLAHRIGGQRSACFSNWPPRAGEANACDCPTATCRAEIRPRHRPAPASCAPGTGGISSPRRRARKLGGPSAPTASSTRTRPEPWSSRPIHRTPPHSSPACC